MLCIQNGIIPVSEVVGILNLLPVAFYFSWHCFCLCFLYIVCVCFVTAVNQFLGFEFYKFCQVYSRPIWGQACSCLPVETQVWLLGREIPWRTAWQPTPVFLPGESRGQRSLVDYSPWDRIELDTTEWLTLSLRVANPRQRPLSLQLFFFL